MTGVRPSPKGRLDLPYDLLSDGDLALADALALPTFVGAGETLLSHLTLLLSDGTVERVFYSLFSPCTDAVEVLEAPANAPAP